MSHGAAIVAQSLRAKCRGMIAEAVRILALEGKLAVDDEVTDSLTIAACVDMSEVSIVFGITQDDNADGIGMP